MAAVEDLAGEPVEKVTWLPGLKEPGVLGGLEKGAREDLVVDWAGGW